MVNTTTHIAQFNAMCGKQVSRAQVAKLLPNYKGNPDLKQAYQTLLKLQKALPVKGKAMVYFDKLKPKIISHQKKGKHTQMALNGLPSIFTRADQQPEETPNTFQLKGQIGAFLGKLQRYMLAMVVRGDFHAGKSEFVWQLVNAFAESNYTVGVFDLEQGGLISKDTKAAIERNVTPANRAQIAVAGSVEGGLDEIKKYTAKFDVIVIDSWQQFGMVTNEQFNELRQEFPNTIWVIIFQQNNKGTTKGGASADYDAPVSLRAIRVDMFNFKKNYMQIEKNRNNPTDRWYYMADKKTVEQNPAQAIQENKNNIT